MGRVFSPKFNDDGELAGMQAVGRDTSRPGDVATLTRLAAIQDPGNSAPFFQQKLEAIDSMAPGRKLSIDPGVKN